MMLNFLPYPKGNRDEWIGKHEVERLSMPFANSDSVKAKELEQVSKGLKSLREYA